MTQDHDISSIHALFAYGGEGRYLPIVHLDADEIPPNVLGETACNIVKLPVMFVVGYCN